MTAKPEILFLAHRIPYPPDKGDKIRSWRLFRHLAARFDVHLGCFVDDPDDWRHEETVQAQCKSAKFIELKPIKARIRSARGFISGAPLTVPYYRDSAMTKWVRTVREHSLAAEVAFSSSMAQYLEPTKPSRPRIVDLCDADSVKWRQYADERSGPMAWVYAREARRLGELERQIIRETDASFVISAEEASVFDDVDRNLHWFGNGVDSDYFNPGAVTGEVTEPVDIVFVGAMDYWANVNAVKWFVHDIWPQVRRHHPHLRFAILGARPTDEVTALAATPGVQVTGRVDDVRPWLARAQLVVAPMRIARGVQNKVLEAMAMAKTVVATSDAAEGIETAPGDDIVIVNDASRYAQAIIDLVENPVKAAEIGAAARQRVLNCYTWSQQLARFDAVVDPILAT